VDDVQRLTPDRVPDAAAWIFGSLIERNTYSPLDGSVPEDIGQMLMKVHGQLESRGEALFMPWLIAGFASVQDHQYNELERWQYGIEAPKAATTTGVQADARSP